MCSQFGHGFASAPHQPGRNFTSQPLLHRQRDPEEGKGLEQPGLNEGTGIHRYEAKVGGQLVNLPLGGRVVTAVAERGRAVAKTGSAMTLEPMVLNALTTRAPGTSTASRSAPDSPAGPLADRPG